ncbi:OsmC-like protein [Clostridium acetireducens DSM 10703]|jgi:uncharacterized OsmC-like protein|uniref:OsmC-like protein n=1 Tax=Clostridium acetireducens DSM 10703 TaxID=1121290 RepID=A0A1E8F014_9CLOT|nr:OsmC family protein [Clostridium acetireducens]OFI06725.1 OsmC-like protein [Clostridium acetireducens DSM 10703]
MEDYIVKYKINGKYLGDGLIENSIDNLKGKFYIENEPSEESKNMSPMQSLLSALSASAQISIISIAKDMDMDIKQLSTTIKASTDKRGMLGLAKVKPYFSSIHQVVNIRTNDSEKINELMETFKKTCPMYNLILDTGINYTINFRLV